MSRPLLVALVGAVLALVAFYATSGARNSGDDGGSTPVVQEPAKSSKSAKSDEGTPEPAKGEATPSSGSEPADKGDARSANSAPAEDGSGSSAAAAPGVPDRVARALERNRTVVLFFRQPRAADDDATARAVAGVRGMRGTAVFSAPISKLSDYEGLTGDLGISRAPAVVIVGKNGNARLIEGFIDQGTLEQEVADSR